MATITIQIPIKLDAIPGACYNAQFWLDVFRNSQIVPDWYKAGEPTLVPTEHMYSPDLMGYLTDDPDEWVERCRVCLQGPTPEHDKFEAFIRDGVHNPNQAQEVYQSAESLIDAKVTSNGTAVTSADGVQTEALNPADLHSETEVSASAS
jgi:hypothetical protein